MEPSRELNHNGRRHTPLPTGSYVVGCTDIMTPDQDGPNSGCFVRIFYPSEADDILNYSNQWPLWLPDPKYLNGYADTFKMNQSLFKLLSKVVLGSVYIPVIWNGPVHRKLTKCPLVIFSHGLTACRTPYSAFCSDLASHGFVVAAVEHRDGSACVSYNLTYSEDKNSAEARSRQVQTEIPDSVNNDKKSNTIDVRDTMDGTKIFPRSFKQEWIEYRHVKKDDDAYQVRNEQVTLRAKECINALKLIDSLNKGEFVDNLLDNGQSFQSTFKSLINISNVALIGHSLGGATIFKALGMDETPFKVVVALDPYMFPIEKELDMLKSLKKPILCINTETFNPPRNNEVMKCLASEEFERKFAVIKGTCHQSQSDVSFVLGPMSRKFFGFGPSDRFVATALNNSLTLQFLAKHMDLELDDKIEKCIEDHKKLYNYGIRN